MIIILKMIVSLELIGVSPGAEAISIAKTVIA